MADHVARRHQVVAGVGEVEPVGVAARTSVPTVLSSG